MTKVHDVLTDILGTVAKLTMSPSDTDELTLPKVIVFYLFSFSFTMFAYLHGTISVSYLCNMYKKS